MLGVLRRCALADPDHPKLKRVTITVTLHSVVVVA